MKISYKNYLRLFLFNFLLLGMLFAAAPAFAISGACSWHGGVNCDAGPSLGGYAQCYDGWVSSAPYNQMEECLSNTTTCLMPDDVTKLTRSLENDVNQEIQAIRDEEQSAISQQERINTENEAEQNALNARAGLTGSSLAASSLAQAQQVGQQALDAITSQYDLQINNIQIQKDMREAAINAEQCSPLQVAQKRAAQCDITTWGFDSHWDDGSNACVCNDGHLMDASGSCIAVDPSLILGSSASGYSCPAYSTGIGGKCVCESGFQPDLYKTVCVAATQPTSTSDVAATSLPVTRTPTSAAPVISSLSLPSFAITKNISIGSSGDNVIALQKFLEAKGFLTMPAGVAEGYFGNLTKLALIAFQKSTGLPPTGWCGPMTRAAINQ